MLPAHEFIAATDWTKVKNPPIKFTLEAAGLPFSFQHDDPEAINRRCLQAWEMAESIFRIRKYHVSCATVELNANWSDFTNCFKRWVEWGARCDEAKQAGLGLDEAISAGGEQPNGRAKAEIVVIVEGGIPRIGIQVLESYLHDVFLMMNICVPGSFDLNRANLVGSADSVEVSLSNVQFELAGTRSESDWPGLYDLPLRRVVSWFDAVRSGVAQLPHNPSERALFALLHIAKLDINPMIVIWIFYAFESLLQTKVGENFSSLVMRLAALLKLDDKQLRTLKSKLRGLYDIRSGIVHGGFEVAHPMHNEVLDKRVDQNYSRIAEAAEFSMMVLIAAIQATISCGWKYPVFSEMLDGSPFEEA